MTTPRRTKRAWQKILEDQRTSGHSIKAYCLEHKICISSFYAQKKKQTSQDSPFIQAQVSPATLSVEQQKQPITLTYKNTTLMLSESTPPQFIADILRCLA